MATGARTTGWLTEAVAAEIRALMGRRDINQAGLSRATGIPKATVSSLLGLRKAMDLEQFHAISVALGAEPDELMRLAIEHARGLERNHPEQMPEPVDYVKIYRTAGPDWPADGA